MAFEFGSTGRAPAILCDGCGAVVLAKGLVVPTDDGAVTVCRSACLEAAGVTGVVGYVSVDEYLAFLCVQLRIDPVKVAWDGMLREHGQPVH